MESINEIAEASGKFIPDLKFDPESQDYLSEGSTVFTADDFVNVPNKVLLDDCVIITAGHNFYGSSYIDEFNSDYSMPSAWFTARKSAYLGLAWLTMAAAFRNQIFVCEISHPKTDIKTLLFEPHTPFAPSLRGAKIAINELQYFAEHPFRQEHMPNDRDNREEYPRVILGRYGDQAENGRKYNKIYSELIVERQLDIKICKSPNAMLGFGSLAGYIFMAEFFLDMSRPSFKHPPHQSFDFEGEFGWTRVASASHLMSFKHTNHTGFFPEDYDADTPMSGTFRNWNH